MSEDSEILAEVDALKARVSDTKSLYREVCALLFFRFGVTPTTNKLYQYVRKGSMGTPAEALAKFWDDLRSKARIELDHPDLPPSVKVIAAEAIAGLWRQASEAARAELAAIRIGLQVDQEQNTHALTQAQQAAMQTLATVEQLRSELVNARELTSQARTELEAERRAHAGAMARVQELQAQLEQARAQQLRLQEAFSTDLAKAREAVEAADQRAAAMDKRALMEIEQERQARAKADKQVEALRARSSAAEARDRQGALEQAEAIARLQARCDAAAAAAGAQLRTNEALDQELCRTREELLASQQEATRYRAEAHTVQALLDRLSLQPTAAPPPPLRSARRKASGA